MKIYFYPPKTFPNSYIFRMREIFSQFGEVINFDPLSSQVRCILSQGFYSRDVLVLNWFENRLLKKQTFFSLTRFVLTFFLLRLLYRKIIWVHHNHVPHNLNCKSRASVQSLITILENFSDITLIHVPLSLNTPVRYLPHPLFSKASDLSTHHELPFGDNSYFVLFGRISPYKNLEAVIENFPSEQNLLIFGLCDNESYAQELKNSFSAKNIKIKPGFVSDEEAQSLVLRSKGLLVTHPAEEFLLSGSVMFGVSLGVPVHTLKTSNTTWLSGILKTGLYLHQDVQTLCRNLTSCPTHQLADVSHFSDNNISRILKTIFQRDLNLNI